MTKAIRIGFGMCKARSIHGYSHPYEKTTSLVISLLSPHSLGLQSFIPDELMTSICQLPEIQTSLNAKSVTNLRLHHENVHANNQWKTIHEKIRDIQRATEIFSQYALGGRDHLATLLFQVDFLNDSGFPHEAALKLKEYALLNNANKYMMLSPFHLMLAQARLEWINGRFNAAIEYAKTASDQSVSEESDEAVLKQTTALNVQAVSRMSQLDLYSKQIDLSTILEVEDILGTFKVASRISSNEYRLSKSSPEALLSTTMALCNQGVAELFFISIKNKKTLLTSSKLSSHLIPIDPAMTAWRQALSYLETTEFNQDQLLVDLLRAKIYCNMSHALLFSSFTSITDHHSTITDSDLKNASEFASLAIKIYNSLITSKLYISTDFSRILKVESDTPISSKGVHISCFLQQDLARALSLAASCYAKSGSAVTAQGLFQTSIDVLESSQGNYPWPLTALDARTTLLGYADLCRQWEKRDTDYRLNLEKAEKIEKSLQPPWKNKASILSGIIFRC